MPGPGLDLVAHEPQGAADVLEEEEDAGDRSTLRLGELAEEKLERPRRRFVKPGMTNYERCFSRHGAGRRLRQQQQQQRGQSLSKLQPPVNQIAAAAAAAGEAAASPPKSPSVKPVSSLSSVLNQVIHGPSRALSSYEDVTTEPPSYKSFVVEQDTDGQLYVASLRGAQFVIPPAQRAPTANQADAHPAARRSEYNLSFVHEPLDDQRLSMPRQSSGSELSSARGFLIKTPSSAEVDTKAPAGKLKSAKTKLLGFSALKSKLAQRSSSAINSSAATPSASSGEADRRSMPAVGANGMRTTEVVEDLNSSLVPMLDETHVDRSRGDSSWEAPPPANAEDEIKPIVNRPLPTDNDDDEDDDSLNRSFLNVRDVDFERLQEIVRVEEEEAVAPHPAPAAAAAAAAARPTNTEAATYGRVRVASTGGTNVTEFLGGFKGQLGYRSGQEGFNPRSRGLRNSRKGVTAASKASKAASDLTRRLRDARSRIPFEFRGDPATAAAYRNRKFLRKGNQKRVHFDLTTNQCREFDVLSEYVPSEASLVIQNDDHEYAFSEDEDEDEAQSYDA